jgi:hypothetical protein
LLLDNNSINWEDPEQDQRTRNKLELLNARNATIQNENEKNLDARPKIVLSEPTPPQSPSPTPSTSSSKKLKLNKTPKQSKKMNLDSILKEEDDNERNNFIN